MDNEFCSTLIITTESHAAIMKDLAKLESLLPAGAYEEFIQDIRTKLLTETVHLEEICADCNGYRAAAISDETKSIITGTCFTECHDD